MHFEPNALYHIYNRSNETVFITRENYLFFLRKVRKFIAPVCNILAYVLMPNHFHFLIQATENSCQDINEKIVLIKIKLLAVWNRLQFSSQSFFCPIPQQTLYL
jgi:REP element-mobilizing transposase RayT